MGDYFDNFINSQVKIGKYSSASEFVRAALRLFEHEETKKSELVEKSGVSVNFNREDFKENMHQKYSAEL